MTPLPHGVATDVASQGRASAGAPLIDAESPDPPRDAEKAATCSLAKWTHQRKAMHHSPLITPQGQEKPNYLLSSAWKEPQRDCSASLAPPEEGVHSQGPLLRFPP